MVIAYFVTMGHYGFWLPNDQRGSGSRYVGSPSLYPFGKASFIQNRRHSRAARAYDRELRRRAQQALDHPPVDLSGEQAWSVAQGFRTTIERTGCVILACAVMPDHSHLVLLRHRYEIEKLVIQLKGDATRRLRAHGRHPFQNLPDERGRLPCMWGRSSWDVYLDTPQEVIEKIDYVRKNPTRAGLSRQEWSFVTEYSAS